MKISTMSKTAYLQAYGEPVSGSGSAETLAMWERIEKIALGDYLILEPETKNSLKTLGRLRDGWKKRLERMTTKLHSNFVVRACANREEKHVVLWKETRQAKNAQTNNPR